MAAATKTTPAPKSYANLVGGNAVFAGIDQGVDFTGKGPVYAIGAGKVTDVQASGTGWPGQGALLTYLLTGGPAKGKSVYVAEDFQAASGIAKGSVVKTGDVLGYATGSGLAPGIEVGWAGPNGNPLAPLPPPRPASQFTPEGQSFSDFVSSVGHSGFLSDVATGPAANMGFGTAGSPFSALPQVPNAFVRDATATFSTPVNAGKSLWGAFTGADSFFKWITDTKNLQRVGEMLAGSVLILVGVVMVGRAATSSGPAKQATGAATAVAAPVRAATTRARPSSRRQRPSAPRTSVQRPAKTKRVALPADQPRPKRGAPGSSRLAKGDRIPY